MIDGQKVVVVMPAYNAAHTLLKTWREVIAHEIVDLVIVVDDASRDDTLALARTLPKVIAHAHPANRGYGANQKTCYASRSSTARTSSSWSTPTTSTRRS